MVSYADQAKAKRIEAARLYAAFDRYADQGKDVAATKALAAGRAADAAAEQYERLAEKES